MVLLLPSDDCPFKEVRIRSFGRDGVFSVVFPTVPGPNGGVSVVDPTTLGSTISFTRVAWLIAETDDRRVIKLIADVKVLFSSPTVGGPGTSGVSGDRRTNVVGWVVARCSSGVSSAAAGVGSSAGGDRTSVSPRPRFLVMATSGDGTGTEGARMTGAARR
jgi:hypothetical protein